MNTFLLDVYSAERPFYEGESTSLVIPTNGGQYGIQAKHYNMIAAIIPGMIKITTPDGEDIIAAVSEGIVKIENNHVLVLVDTAELPEEIDEKLALLSQEQAREAILQKKSRQDYYAAQAKMARAISRLKVKRHSG